MAMQRQGDTKGNYTPSANEPTTDLQPQTYATGDLKTKRHEGQDVARPLAIQLSVAHDSLCQPVLHPSCAGTRRLMRRMRTVEQPKTQGACKSSPPAAPSPAPA